MPVKTGKILNDVKDSYNFAKALKFVCKGTQKKMSRLTFYTEYVTRDYVLCTRTTLQHAKHCQAAMRMKCDQYQQQYFERVSLRESLETA